MRIIAILKYIVSWKEKYLEIWTRTKKIVFNQPLTSLRGILSHIARKEKSIFPACIVAKICHCQWMRVTAEHSKTYFQISGTASLLFKENRYKYFLTIPHGQFFDESGTSHVFLFPQHFTVQDNFSFAWRTPEKNEKKVGMTTICQFCEKKIAENSMEFALWGWERDHFRFSSGLGQSLIKISS